MPRPKIENDVEKMLVDACAIRGIRCIKGKTAIGTGFPDRIVFHRFRKKIYYIEVKNQNYEQQLDQKEWEKHIRESGGEFFLIDGPVEMKRFIKGFIE